MSEIPKHDSKEYKKMRDDARLVAELGQVIIEQYGKADSIKLLDQYKEKKQAEAEGKDKK
jgi:hypothetical protein